jgi:hypothetical protein
MRANAIFFCFLTLRTRPATLIDLSSCMLSVFPLSASSLSCRISGGTYGASVAV